MSNMKSGCFAALVLAFLAWALVYEVVKVVAFFKVAFG